MKKYLFLSLLSILVFNSSFAQNQPAYSKLTGEALKLYQNKEYLKSAQKYSEAFAVSEKSELVNDRYNAACSWALVNQSDSAFFHLFKVVRSGKFLNYSHLISDVDFKSLYPDKRWNEVVKIVQSNKGKAEVNLDKPLIAALDSIYNEDQNYRQQIEVMQKKYGWESPEMKAHWQVIRTKDSVNLVKVKKILADRGWLGADVVGVQGNSTLFLVIQHSDLKTQQHYLPVMREAVKKGNARGSSLALLEDRVALGLGKRQIYGSQVSRNAETGEYYVLPLEDPDNVDKRRAEVGLGTIQEYISNWNMIWDVQDYKKKLPSLEAKEIK